MSEPQKQPTTVNQPTTARAGAAELKAQDWRRDRVDHVRMIEEVIKAYLRMLTLQDDFISGIIHNPPPELTRPQHSKLRSHLAEVREIKEILTSGKLSEAADHAERLLRQGQLEVGTHPLYLFGPHVSYIVTLQPHREFEITALSLM